MDLTELASVLVMWHEAVIGLLDALEQVHVQSGTWNAELDDKFPTFNGITSSALTCCRGDDGLVDDSFGFCVTLQLRDRIVLLKEPLYLVLR